MSLKKRFKIDESSYRLRYFVASLIEDSMKSLFHNCVCLPFGSSSNRFGLRSADLDLSLAWNNPFEGIETNYHHRTSAVAATTDSSTTASSSNSVNTRQSNVNSSKNYSNEFDFDKHANGAVFFQTRSPGDLDDRGMARIHLEMVEFVLGNVIINNLILII